MCELLRPSYRVFERQSLYLLDCSLDLGRIIHLSLRRAFIWVLANQVNDGGFVFRLYESFRYGSDNTSSKSNEGAMLPTWFRTLSLTYLARFLNTESGFVLTRCPGYEF